MRSRPLLLAAMVAAALGLSGCTVVGEVYIGRDTVTVDLMVEHTKGMGPCDSDGMTPVLTVTPRDAGSQSGCTITGTIPTSTTVEGQASAYYVTASQGYTFLRMPAMAYVPGDPQEDVTVDLTAHFDGPVLAASADGLITGSQVRWTDGQALKREGVAATASTSWLGPWFLPAGLGLLIGGAAGAGGVLWWWRRAGRDGGPTPAVPTPAGPAPGGVGSPGVPAEDAAPAVGAAPEGFQDAVPRPTGPGRDAEAGTAADADGDDPTIWSRP